MSATRWDKCVRCGKALRFFITLHTVHSYASSAGEHFRHKTNSPVLSSSVRCLVSLGNSLRNFLFRHWLQSRYSNSLCSSHCRHHVVTASILVKWLCDFIVPHLTQCVDRCRSSGIFCARRWAAEQAEHDTQWPGRIHIANTSSGRIGFAPKPAAGYVYLHAKQVHVWPSDLRLSRASSLCFFKT